MSSLTLRVDGQRWRHHIMHYLARYQSDLVPVIKGNGYGFGIPTLAREAQGFEAKTVACYNEEEAVLIRSQFTGDILLLSPIASMREEWVIHTLSTHSSTTEGKEPKRFLLELLSPVLRHGYSLKELIKALDKYGKSGRCEGLAIHLPLDQKSSDDLWVPWIDRQLRELNSLDVEPSDYAKTIWISHISDEGLARLRILWPEIIWRLRVGTDLWLGARSTLRAESIVLDRHKIAAKTRVGYRQNTQGNGWLVIASGGTADGIGLETSTAGVKNVIKSLLRLMGWHPSPFTWNGVTLKFAEAPHMHNSLLFIRGEGAPDIGQVLGLSLRFTTTTFNQVIFE